MLCEKIYVSISVKMCECQFAQKFCFEEAAAAVSANVDTEAAAPAVADDDVTVPVADGVENMCPRAWCCCCCFS